MIGAVVIPNTNTTIRISGGGVTNSLGSPATVVSTGSSEYAEYMPYSSGAQLTLNGVNLTTVAFSKILVPPSSTLSWAGGSVLNGSFVKFSNSP